MKSQLDKLRKISRIDIVEHVMSAIHGFNLNNSL